MFGTLATGHPVDPRTVERVLTRDSITFALLALVLLVTSLVSGIVGVGVLAGLSALAALGSVVATATDIDPAPTATN